MTYDLRIDLPQPGILRIIHLYLILCAKSFYKKYYYLRFNSAFDFSAGSEDTSIIPWVAKAIKTDALLVLREPDGRLRLERCIPNPAYEWIPDAKKPCGHELQKMHIVVDLASQEGDRTAIWPQFHPETARNACWLRVQRRELTGIPESLVALRRSVRKIITGSSE